MSKLTLLGTFLSRGWRLIVLLIRSSPKWIALVFFAMTIITAIVQSAKQHDASIMIRSVGGKIIAADNNIYQQANLLPTATSGMEKFKILFNMLGSLFVMYYMFRIFMWFIDIITGHGSAKFGYVVLSLIIIGLLEMTTVLFLTKKYEDATQLIIPFRGLYAFVVNLPYLFNFPKIAQKELMNQMNLTNTTNITNIPSGGFWWTIRQIF